MTDRDKAVCQDYKDKVPVLNIMDAHGISVTEVYRIIGESGIPRRNAPRGLGRKAKYDGPVQDYEDGKPVGLILASYGISSATLYAALRRRGIEPCRGRKQWHGH